MKIKVDREIFEKWPDLKIGVMVGLGLNNTEAKQKSLELLRAEEKNQQKLIKLEELENQDFVRAWRQVYRDFGASPKKYKSSIEALLTRVLTEKELPDINPLVNFYNYLSLKYHLPFGGEDLDKVKGDVSLDFAKGSEKGKYIGSDKVESALPGEVIYQDELGFICRRFNWREADRTKFTPKTKNAILVAELLPLGKSETLQKAIKELTDLVEKELGGKVAVAVLDKQNPVLEFDFVSGSKLTSGDLALDKMKKVEKKEIIAKFKLPTLITPLPEWLPEERIKKALYLACEELGKGLVLKDEIEVKHPTLGGHGDFASNIALVLAKKLKKNPGEIAKNLVEKIKDQSLDWVGKIETAGPGFINFWLSKEYLFKQARGFLKDNFFKEKLGKAEEGKVAVIDYSAPNIAKSFGIGHLRSTSIGQAIYNLYSFLGWETIGDNHLGDWGTQFGKLIVAIKKWWPKELQELTVEELEKLYVKFHTEAKKDKSLENEGRAWFKKLEDGDQEAKEIWQVCTDVSLKEFKRIYDLLGVRIDYAYGEAFYHFGGWMEKVLADLKKRKLVKKSQGALVIEIPEIKVPGMLVKSDGGTTYLFRDMATIFFRMEKWNPDLVIYEVGADQKFHFQQVFAASQKAGYIDSKKLVHVPHGLIRWKHGKFSTRKGDTIHLEEILKEGIEKAYQIVEKSQTSEGLNKSEKMKIAKAVGIGGVKFNDLKQEPEKDIIFEWEKILTLAGYSAPYLQYTYARCASVLAKAENLSFEKISLSSGLEKEELSLLRSFYQFPEVILISANNFAPHLLAQYLFDLAQKFNLFYQKHRILSNSKLQTSNTQEFRLFLTKIAAQVLKMGLEILGIEVLEKM
ncbi:arginine--tRNA ligase [Candidatus Shapirobacteria bacterium]|nr:arginine--tRNA ligase [Candidatus Shapirobacteria bacterium]